MVNEWNLQTFIFHLVGRAGKAFFAYEGDFDALLEELDNDKKTLLVYTPDTNSTPMRVALLKDKIIGVEEY
ncbi:hypothetical protein ACFQ4J_06590 [Laceyella tengchongensis]|jgi:hypothetical protein